MPKRNVDDVIEFVKTIFYQKSIHKDTIPRFSQKYETILDYLKSPEFKSAKPAYQQRVLKQALEHPTWTLAEARGHSKPTGNTWRIFDETGLFEERVEFKNRKEETKYAEYLNAVKDYLATGDESGLKTWFKRWGRDANQFILKDGTKVKTVTDLETLSRLHEFGELPSGEDLYTKG